MMPAHAPANIAKARCGLSQSPALQGAVDWPGNMPEASCLDAGSPLPNNVKLRARSILTNSFFFCLEHMKDDFGGPSVLHFIQVTGWVSKPSILHFFTHFIKLTG